MKADNFQQQKTTKIKRKQLNNERKASNQHVEHNEKEAPARLSWRLKTQAPCWMRTSGRHALQNMTAFRECCTTDVMSPFLSLGHCNAARWESCPEPCPLSTFVIYCAKPQLKIFPARIRQLACTENVFSRIRDKFVCIPLTVLVLRMMLRRVFVLFSACWRFFSANLEKGADSAKGCCGVHVASGDSLALRESLQCQTRGISCCTLSLREPRPRKLLSI